MSHRTMILFHQGISCGVGVGDGCGGGGGGGGGGSDRSTLPYVLIDTPARCGCMYSDVISVPLRTVVVLLLLGVS